MNTILQKKNDFIEYCQKKDLTFPNYKIPKLSLNNKLETVLIEFRLLPYTIFIIKNNILMFYSNFICTLSYFPAYSLTFGDLNFR